MRTLASAAALIWTILASTTMLHAACPSEDAGLLEARDGKFSTEIIVENRTSRPIQLFWINYDGERVKYADIGEGHEYSQQTYMSHPWVVAGPKNNCLGVYFPDGQPRRIIVENVAYDVSAGTIWNDADARAKCPKVCKDDNAKWTGRWKTTAQGQMSVCNCRSN